ncbi:Lsr2 family protein [Arthrobacter sp. UYCu712]|uniref:histone-like nucleoid-structuring protein Lsr2 n=1 Tax=Arthrobacter sp. UYCu712 TaxID=3156340 RepID=UPI003399D07D
MAVRRITVLVDDVDGSPAVETVTFAMDGSTYEIDLNEAHTTQLRDALRRYVEAARRTIKSRGKVRPADQGRGGKSTQVRAWAKEQGLPVSDRGSIPANVLEKHVAAH